MGCGTSSRQEHSEYKPEKTVTVTMLQVVAGGAGSGGGSGAGTAFKSAVLIQRWYRRYIAQLEVRRRCTWTIFQSIEYKGEQDQIKLYDFFSYLMDHFTPSNSKERDFICRMFTEEESYKDTELEKYCEYESIEVPDFYKGPCLSFPIMPDHAAALVEAFKLKQQLHAYYVLKLLHETRKHLKQLPNITRISTCCSKDITICGDLHGRLDDLFLIFYKFVSTLRPRKKKEKTKQLDANSTQGGKISVKEKSFSFEPACIPQRSGSLTYSSSSSFLPNPCKDKRSASSPTTMTIDKKEISKRVRQSVEEELEKCRRQVGFSESYAEPTSSNSVSESDSESNETQIMDTNDKERKQIVDILWSDPMPQDGCKSNTVRGGGCYFGPDVTEKILQKHGLQLLIRSHECKQDGYEFCHNRKVLTIFSASNYYEIGSNKGAYVKLGPDLIPHFVQYQASKTTTTLTMKQRVSRVEESALRALREKLSGHKSNLIKAFKYYDKDSTGTITLNDWATALESVLNLRLPWRMLRPQLVTGRSIANGLLKYTSWFDELAVQQPIREHLHASLLEALYRNRSNLETIFRIIDSDNSGLISFDEFHHTWKLLSSHLNIEISDNAICDLARSIDFNKDGNIDINEFLEAFRLADKPRNGDR
ncbi:serine/threonine-protein phosphatase with EF-hands 2 isoform X6 [Ambystoma mexicanum]|uniref:serine/threonine-protein phosphatase with EF-hands 2 isoform X6 n=1 Tax=Ambystoma mexicanum TaxID=8296 RepID=UPI0037E758BF